MSACKVMGGNQYLGLVAGGIVINLGGLAGASMGFLGLTFTNGRGGTLSALAAGALIAIVERWIKKRTPDALKVHLPSLGAIVVVGLLTMLRLVGQLDLPGLMLNASVLTQQQVEHQVKLLRAQYPNLRLRGHHNYYPLPESGLSLGFLLRRTRQYTALGIPVTACVAAHHAPRLPLACGLPTVEAYRTLHPGEAALRLVTTGVIDDVLIGDPFASGDELAGVALACGGGVPVLRVRPDDGVTAQERRIAFAAPHHANTLF